MNTNNKIKNLVEIILPNYSTFSILKETLTRIGLSNKERTKLTQTCHILFKRGKCYILHFKEMFLLDNKSSTLNDTDIARRNSIINYLIHLKLCKLASGEEKLQPALARHNNFTIIPFNEKQNWELTSKYTIGNPANKPFKKTIDTADIAVVA